MKWAIPIFIFPISGTLLTISSVARWHPRFLALSETSFWNQTVPWASAMLTVVVSVVGARWQYKKTWRHLGGNITVHCSRNSHQPELGNDTETWAVCTQLTNHVGSHRSTRFWEVQGNYNDSLIQNARYPHRNIWKTSNTHKNRVNKRAKYVNKEVDLHQVVLVPYYRPNAMAWVRLYLTFTV